jgi:hypothetical protein
MGRKNLKTLLKNAGVSAVAQLPWTPFAKAEPLPQLPNDTIYLNSRYQVNVRKYRCPDPFGDCYELSVKTRDKAPVHDWRDLQRIKNELMGEDVEAVEVYPSEKRLVDTANQYYLYAFPELKTSAGELQRCFPFGFRERLVCEEAPENGGQRRFAPEHRPKDLTTQEEMKKRFDEEMKLRQK